MTAVSGLTSCFELRLLGAVLVLSCGVLKAMRRVWVGDGESLTRVSWGRRSGKAWTLWGQTVPGVIEERGEGGIFRLV